MEDSDEVSIMHAIERCNVIHALERLGERLCHTRTPIEWSWTIGPVQEQRLKGPSRSLHMATLVLKDTQQALLSIQPVDKKGNPAEVDGAPTWESSNEDSATLQVSEDGLSATIVAGNPGDAQVSVNADADLGEGVTNITGTLDVSVVAGDAVALNIGTAAPEEQP